MSFKLSSSRLLRVSSRTICCWISTSRRETSFWVWAWFFCPSARSLVSAAIRSVRPAAVLEQVRVLLTAREQFTGQKIANVNALKALERKTITTRIAIQAYEQAITRLTQNIKEIDQEIKRLVKQDDSFNRMITAITSTPGIGMLLAANLVVMTSGFARTRNHKKIASYTGISPIEHSSGTSVYRRPRSRRYGPSRMRKLLYLAAMSVSTHDAAFRRYYLRKVAEGKPKRLVLNNIANKLLKVVCALVRSESAYIPNYTSSQPLLLRRA